jgi:PKD repeat protein
MKMKKIFTSITLICLFALSAFAQGNYTLTGIVTNTAGAPVTNHQVCIYTDSSQASLIYFNCVNTDTMGSFSVLIPGGAMPGPNIVFYVSTMSCNSFLLQQVQNNQGTTNTGNVSFTVCTALGNCLTTIYAIPDTMANPLNYFFSSYTTVNGVIVGVTSYNWSFGDSSTNSTLASPQHTYSAPGTYTVCLTTTSINGCTSSSCTTITVAGGNGCNAQFGHQASAAGGTTIFNALFGANYTYSWSFGDGTSATGQYPGHVYTNPGTYIVCLVVNDAVANCSDTACYVINISGNTFSHYVSGQVSLPGLGMLTPADYGTVYLIRHDSLFLNAVDTTTIDSTGHYYFGNVPSGAYLVKAALSPASAYYNFYMPTYHTSSLFWITATDVLVLNTGVNNANISMISGANPGGPGFIGGSVLQGANRLASPGDPIVGITILLLDMSNNPIASTTTDVNGNYSFPNIAYGTYKIYAELAGRTTAPSIVTIDAATPSISNVNVEVNSSTILNIKKNAIEKEIVVGLYPNPTSDILAMYFDLTEAANLKIEIENTLGQVVFTDNYKAVSGKQKITTSVQHLLPGMYLVSIWNGNKVSISKFFKSE